MEKSKKIDEPKKIDEGYYIKARCIRDSSIAHSPPHIRETWDYLLREANHKDGKYNGFTIKRGQLFRTYKEIREALCWYIGYRKMMYNENHMKASMKYLTKQLMITATKQPRGMLITILNYDYYQTPMNYKITNEATTEDPTKQPTDNQGALSINKNDKNENNKTQKTYMSDSIEYRLANYLFNFILKNNPEYKKPDINTWAQHIDYMIRLDKRNPEKIKEIIEWCQKDTPDKHLNEKGWKGWAGNILCTQKLRERFDVLIVKKNESKQESEDDRYDF